MPISINDSFSDNDDNDKESDDRSILLVFSSWMCIDNAHQI